MPATVSDRTSRSLVHGLDLLRLFTIEQPIRSIAELADQMSVSRPTAHRYASTCLELGYLEQAPMRRYRLAPQAAVPGVAMIDSLRITRQARPIVRKLREETEMTTSQAVLAGTDVLYLQRLCGYEQGLYELEKGLGSGSRLPAAMTAAGLALLAPAPTKPQVAPSSPATPITREGGLHRFALGLAIVVQGNGKEPASALEITMHAHSRRQTDLTTDLEEALQTAARALRVAILDDRPGSAN